jgi:hypothetical protein
MQNILSMQERVVYLKLQAERFREQGTIAHSEILRAQFFDLAKRCDDIAENLAENIPIHERIRSSGSTHSSTGTA